MVVRKIEARENYAKAEFMVTCSSQSITYAKQGSSYRSACRVTTL